MSTRRRNDRPVRLQACPLGPSTGRARDVRVDSEADMGLFLSEGGSAGMDLAGCERNAGAEAPHSHGVPAGSGPSGAGTTS